MSAAPPPTVIVVGGGIAGLSGALLLQARGCRVTVLESGLDLGGKIHQIASPNGPIDAGPTVLTMQWVFERIFEDVGERLGDHVPLARAEVVARHAWDDGTTLDLFFDRQRSIDAVDAFAGRSEADGYARYLDYAADIYTHAERTFITSESPSIRAMARHSGFAGLLALFHIDPFRKMARSLKRFFKNPKLVQLFARYATYFGASPFLAPATLNLIAHVEQDGVWLPAGGMVSLSTAIARLFETRGGRLMTGAKVTRVLTRAHRTIGVETAGGVSHFGDAVLFCGDVAAVTDGLLGPAAQRAAPGFARRNRSLSALTVAAAAPTSGFDLASHNVFFHASSPYAAEFRDILDSGRLPTHPTVYVRAQDRDNGGIGNHTPERLFWIINAPALGDTHRFTDEETESCLKSATSLLAKCGLHIHSDPATWRRMTPTDWNDRFPHTGGALYGRATHSPWASLRRAGVRSPLKGFYLAGGSVHPGAGVPMAALSGRLAANAVLADLGMTSSPP